MAITRPQRWALTDHHIGGHHFHPPDLKDWFVWGMRLHHPFSDGDRMTAIDPLKKYCPHCGEQFGHAWGGVGLKQHLWEAHGIPGEAKFNGKLIQFPKEDSNQ